MSSPRKSSEQDPDEYYGSVDDVPVVQDIQEIVARFKDLRKQMRKRLLFLALPILPSELRNVADFIGTSDELLRFGRDRSNDARLERVFVYGSRFLAESLDVLFNAPQIRAVRGDSRVDVVAPWLRDDCPLAQAAPLSELESFWNRLQTNSDPDKEIFPIASLASSTSAKAFVGARGGAICTSHNASAVFDRALELRPRVFFLPDADLGRFAAYSVGLKESDLVVWRRAVDAGTQGEIRSDASLSFQYTEELRLKKAILWEGSCPTYRQLTPNQIASLRETRPNVRIAVPSRCSSETRELADAVGTFDDVLRAVLDSPDDVVWALAFDKNFIRKLKKQTPGRAYFGFGDLTSDECAAHNFKLERFGLVLNSFNSSQPFGRISVPDFVAAPTFDAFERMFQMEQESHE